jgi:hypothetical protein
LAATTANYRKLNPLTPEGLKDLTIKSIKREGVPVSVYNTKTKKRLNFSNETEVGRHLGITRQAVYNAIRRNSLVKRIFTIIKK